VVLRNLAGNLSCPDDVLRRLSASKDYFVLEGVVRNVSCPLEILGQLSSIPELARPVAAHPACPAVVLDRLSRYGSSGVRESVAAHPACPAVVLDRLSRDGNGLVRMAVAANPVCPPEVLGRLLKDTKVVVARIAADNPNTSRAARAMYQLAQDRPPGLAAR
jgi:hypothetical protein